MPEPLPSVPPASKLDARLAALLALPPESYATADPFEADAQRRLRRSGPLAFLRGALEADFEDSPPASFLAFVTVRGDPRFLSGIGARVRSVAGDIATAVIPLSEARRIEAHPDVIAIEWSGGVRPLAVGATLDLREGLGFGSEHAALQGKGTVIGIIDTEGLDFYHPAFATEGGRPCVDYLWDQTAPLAEADRKRGPAPWGYGVEHTKDDIDAETNPAQRTRYGRVSHRALKASHGTFVASIAAGRGGGMHPCGVAPGSRLIYVHVPHSGPLALASMVEVAEALDYVFQRAGQAPCVVNLSLGDELGPHDGTSPVERFIDHLLDKPGRAVVIAAGNAHGEGRHVRGRVRAGAGAVLAIETGPSPLDPIAFEVWCPGGASLDIAVEGPPGTGKTETVAPGEARAFDIGRTRIIISSLACSPINGRAMTRVDLFSAVQDGAVDPGLWKVVLSGRDAAGSAWDAWIDHPYRWAPGSSGESLAFDALTVTSPATCRSAVAVGAWDGGTQSEASFSSRCLDHDGLAKPDVWALATVRAASACTVASTGLFTGTSAAAPQVTGLLALLFEQYGPALTARHIQEGVRRCLSPSGLERAAIGPIRAELLFKEFPAALDRAGIALANRSADTVIEQTKLQSGRAS